MKDLDVNNPFWAGSPEHLAYQRAYALDAAYPRRDHKAMCGRVLGYMLTELPWNNGLVKIATEVNSCITNQQLVELGNFYITHFLRAFRAAKGPTPAPSEQPSRPPCDDERDMTSRVISDALQDHHTANHQVNPGHGPNVYTAERASAQALKRDGYRCMLSGKLDAASKSALQGQISTAALAALDARDAAIDAAAAPLSSQLQQKAAELAEECTALLAAAHRATATLATFPNAPTLCVTNAAHIFPESTNTDLGNDKKKDYASSLCAVMERFGQRALADELAGSKIHRLANIITLDHFLRTQFDRLALWLEADDTQRHVYRICSTDNDIIQGLPDVVTFASYHADLELPDPRYIKMHAACCRVAHMSGAAEYMDGIIDDLDKGQTKVLSADGSGNRLLEFALLGAT